MLKSFQPFFTPILAFAAFLLILLISMSKADSFFLLHEAGHPHLDLAMFLGTYLGDGFASIPVVLLLLFFASYRKALVFTISFAVAGLGAQALKKGLFADFKRPLGHFGEEGLQLVEGLRMHENFSFPSGHTAAGLAIFFGLMLLNTNNKWWQITCGIGACFVGYTRIYLGQHFPADVFTSLLFSSTVCLLVFFWAKNWRGSKWDKNLLA